MAFDPDAYLAQPTEFDPDTFLTEQPIEPPTETAADIGLAAIAGANELLPAIAGIPADLTQNIANLGIAGYGMAKHLLTGDTDFPETLSGMPGTSQWIRQKIQEGSAELGGGDPFALPDPASRLQQNIKMGSSILSSGLIAPSKTPTDVLKNIAGLTAPAAGAITARELFPDEPLAPMVGMMAPSAVSAGKQTIMPKLEASKAAIKAIEQGYKIPPALAKGTKTQQFLEGAAGPVPTKQRASIHNQQVTNRMIKRDIGYPDDVPLSPEGLNEIRNIAGLAYDKAAKAGMITPDKSLITSLNNVARRGSALSKEFPQATNKDIVKLVDSYKINKPVSSEAIVDLVKQLRAEKNAGMTSPDPATKAMAAAKGKVADSFDKLLERNLQTRAPEIVPELKAARQTIAKTYTIQKALKGENVDAVALGRELNKGKPLSGATRDVAEFGQNFKGAAQTSPPQQTNFRPMDLLTGAGGGAVFGPEGLALMGARPALRSGLLSSPYQKSLINEGITSRLMKILGTQPQLQPGIAPALNVLLENQ